MKSFDLHTKPSAIRGQLFLAFAVLMAFATHASAQTQIHGTRIIYPAEEREVTVSVDNVGKAPRLLQVWVDNGDERATAETAVAPFLLTPPISRVEPGKGQSFRLMFTGGELPQDRESVFWFNVLEVPPKPEQKSEEVVNYLQFAVRTRLKIFYRSKDLKGEPLAALETMTWRLVGDGASTALECTNPTPYNISIANIRFKGQETAADTATPAGGMCSPLATTRIAMPGRDNGSGHIVYNAINDYGGFVEREAAYSK